MQRGEGRATTGPTDDAPPRPAQPPYLSPSAAAMFRQCARRWQHRYVHRLADPPGEPALVGTLAHRVLEVLLNEPPEARDQQRARRIAAEVWPEMAAEPDFTRLGLAEEQVRAFKWRAWHAIVGLWAVEDPATVEVAATEQRVEASLGGVPFLGVIDRVDVVDGDLVVTDYKSGRPPRPRYVEERLDQVLLYAAAAGTVHGRLPARARLVYLGSNEISVTADAGRVGAAVDRLATTWRALGDSCAADEFPASAGAHCAWCPFVAGCAEGRAELVRRAGAGWAPAHAPAFAAGGPLADVARAA
jgi:putative RecB family exonuclease